MFSDQLERHVFFTFWILLNPFPNFKQIRGQSGCRLQEAGRGPGGPGRRDLPGGSPGGLDPRGYTHPLVERDVPDSAPSSRGCDSSPPRQASLKPHQLWKQPECPSTGGQMSKMWSSHTMECESASKRKETLTRAVTWMNREDIVLSEMRQSQKDKFYRILLIRGAYSDQIHRDIQQKKGGHQGLGRDGESVFHRNRDSV